MSIRNSAQRKQVQFRGCARCGDSYDATTMFFAFGKYFCSANCKASAKEIFGLTEQKAPAAEPVNSVDLIFKQVLTEDEFDQLSHNGQRRRCCHCTKTFPLSDAVFRESRIYCSENCINKMVRETAPCIKPQPRAFQVDGWDV